jgi:RNA polymerase sigma-70 factor (ECF subfamily)
MVAGLVRIFGSDEIDLVEDVVQEALVRALKVWPYRGIPERPEAWWLRVARNLALDVLRRRRIAGRKLEELEQWTIMTGSDTASAPLPEELVDDSLRMMFMCCHPRLSIDSRVALTLKTLCGFGVAEIARALLAQEPAIAQRLTRAKRSLQEAPLPFEVPGGSELSARLDSVLEVLYLMFNEGYSAHRGEQMVRMELVDEAVRLAELLVVTAATRQPKVHALLALMRLVGARLPARTDAAGEPLTLATQDRSRWDRTWLARGVFHFEQSIGGTELSAFHLEAAIASCHAAAPRYADTDWATILTRYDQLLGLHASPVVALNRVVVVAKVHGVEVALRELEDLEGHVALRGYYLLPATRAQLLWMASRHQEACAAFRAAASQECTAPERQFLLRRAELCGKGGAAEDV